MISTTGQSGKDKTMESVKRLLVASGGQVGINGWSIEDL